jgi:small subunit ribosomal protein S3Ae
MAKVSAKKPKTKKWVKIIAPKIFNEAELGETITATPSKVKGKVIDTSLANLIGDFSKQHFKVRLVVDEVKDGVGMTKIKSVYVSRSYIVRRVRKGASKVEINQKVKLKGDTDIVAKVILVTAFKAHNTQVQILRSKLEDHISKTFKNYNLETLVMAIFAKKIQTETIEKLKKVYPIKYLEVIEIRTVKPKDSKQ